MTTAPLINWWRRRRFTKPRYPRVVRYDARSQAPERIHPRIIAVVGTPDRPKWVVFDCPCGRGHEIALSLQTSHHPHWQIVPTPNDGVTLWPSVDSLTTYRCHFFVRAGRVSWVQEDQGL